MRYNSKKLYYKNNQIQMFIIDEAHKKNFNIQMFLSFIKYHILDISQKIMILSATIEQDEDMYFNYFDKK